ncbi:MAG TPA: histidine kinase [Gaiellaceae bacterium]
MSRPLQFARNRRWLLDGALATAVAASGLLEVWANAGIQPKSAAASCEVALGLALAWRRRFPLATTVAVSVAGTAEAVAGVPLQQPIVPLLVFVIAVYSLVTHAPRQRALLGAAVILVAIALQTLSQHKGVGNFIFPLVFLVGAWITGRTIYARTARTTELEREQDERAHAAVEEERRRIARELHDILAHSLSVLVLQAGAADQVLERDPARAREIMQSIRAAGQEAIDELATLLALEHGKPEHLLEPQPTLADLDRLLTKTREAGLPVELEIEGERRELPAALELSAYRIIQEGLTNALKHAGAHRARTVLRYRQHELELEVSDDGAGHANGRGSHRGLAGIGERVSVFGGHFDAGPRPDGGWTLRANLPLPR